MGKDFFERGGLFSILYPMFRFFFLERGRTQPNPQHTPERARKVQRAGAACRETASLPVSPAALASRRGAQSQAAANPPFARREIGVCLPSSFVWEEIQSSARSNPKILTFFAKKRKKHKKVSRHLGSSTWLVGHLIDATDHISISSNIQSRT